MRAERCIVCEGLAHNAPEPGMGMDDSRCVIADREMELRWACSHEQKVPAPIWGGCHTEA